MSFTGPGRRSSRQDAGCNGFEAAGLMQEGLRRFGLVESARAGACNSIYCGINVSRVAEPLDQLDALLLFSRLRRIGLDCGLTVFIAGRYGQLNGRPAQGLEDAEIRKAEALGAAARAIGVPIRLLRTRDLWKDPDYWLEAYGRRSESGIISERKGAPFSQVASGFEREIIDAMPAGFMEALGPFDAPALYRLLEVAEAGYLARSMGVDCKVGPASEQEYDVFIGRFMGIIELRQPLDFKSSPPAPRPLVPYIGKEGEARLLLSDGKEELGKKVFALAQRAEGQPLYYGGFMNPFARTAILAVEAAAAADSAPVRASGSLVRDGAAMLGFFENAGMSGLARLAPVVAECLWAYLVRPIRMAGAAPCASCGGASL